MKGIFWTDPNKSLQIIDFSDEALLKFGLGFGHEIVVLTDEHIEALQSGKCVAFHDSEYSTFLVSEKRAKDETD